MNTIASSANGRLRIHYKRTYSPLFFIINRRSFICYGEVLYLTVPSKHLTQLHLLRVFMATFTKHFLSTARSLHGWEMKTFKLGTSHNIQNPPSVFCRQYFGHETVPTPATTDRSIRRPRGQK